MQAHFETIQRISDTITLPHAIHDLNCRVAEDLDLSQLLERLIQGKGQPNTLTNSEKLELWDRLKILSMSLVLASTIIILLVLWLCKLSYCSKKIKVKYAYFPCFIGFTRMALSVWAITMLSLYIKVQVNILGRHLYIDTARSLGSSNSMVRTCLFLFSLTKCSRDQILATPIIPIG